MNFMTLGSVAVVTLAINTAASAQWTNSGSGMNIGIGGSYGKYKDKYTETGPDGNSVSRTRTITNNDFRWGVGVGGYSNTNSGYYGGGYGGGYYGGGYYGGGYGYGGGGCYGPLVVPYYGGGCAPVVVPYSPFTGVYGNPCYAPQVIAPAAYCPQAAIVW
jgi:hypothetical protein